MTKRSAIGKSYELRNSDDSLRVELIEYGATVTKIVVPDRQGRLADVLLGCPTKEDHARPHPHFNCLVGRFANRITNAQFVLDGNLYELEANIPPHQLHSGHAGLANRIWHSAKVENGCRFDIESPDGDAGYPGDVHVEAEYTIHQSSLKLEISATTNKATPISLTAHHYFNLSGVQGSSIEAHQIRINADSYLPISSELTQLGEIATVTDTPFDLRAFTPIGDRLKARDEQMSRAGGYDHNFVINDGGLRQAAKVIEPNSGRTLTLSTDQPGMQFYTSNTLRARGKDGVTYQNQDGFCLETQQFPDAPNHANYPNAILRPGDEFKATTVWEFGVLT